MVSVISLYSFFKFIINFFLYINVLDFDSSDWLNNIQFMQFKVSYPKGVSLCNNIIILLICNKLTKLPFIVNIE